MHYLRMAYEKEKKPKPGKIAVLHVDMQTTAMSS